MDFYKVEDVDGLDKMKNLNNLQNWHSTNSTVSSDAEIAEMKLTQLARTYMDNREYGKAIDLLSAGQSPTATFQRLYCTFLMLERRHEQQMSTFNDNFNLPPSTINSEKYTAQLQSLLKQVSLVLSGAAAGKIEDGDPFLLYLYALIAKRLKLMKQCMDSLIASIIAFPFNWSAWSDLLSCIKSPQDVLYHSPIYLLSRAI